MHTVAHLSPLAAAALAAVLLVSACAATAQGSRGLLPQLHFTTMIAPAEGVVDDCCCEIAQLSDANDRIQPLLEQLKERTFFKYFRVNYLRECPFWAESALCSADGTSPCGVDECDPSEIPPPWRDDAVDASTAASISPHPFWDDSGAGGDVWLHPDSTRDAVYLNLQLNPERYTGYGGFNSTRIWMAIYNENCFNGPDLCLEQRVFYRLMSGFHASTTAHIFEYYATSPPAAGALQQQAQWQPQLDLFTWRLGMFPERIHNLYFSFLFLMRAVGKASHHLLHYNYDTGHLFDDSKVRGLMHELLSSRLSEGCLGVAFDERSMFQSDGSAQLKRDFAAKFRNISEIMDCIGCETCKIHAKLQILGIGAALKILLADNLDLVVANLQRNELIALINTAEKFSDSIQIVERMRLREKLRIKQSLAAVVAAALAAIALLATLVVCWPARRASAEQQRGARTGGIDGGSGGSGGSGGGGASKPKGE